MDLFIEQHFPLKRNEPKLSVCCIRCFPFDYLHYSFNFGNAISGLFLGLFSFFWSNVYATKFVDLGGIRTLIIGVAGEQDEHFLLHATIFE